MQLNALVRDQPLDVRPGTRWHDSNSGYVLLGAIIERVWGLSYAAFLQQHIFTPLDLANTGDDVNHPALPGHATGYASGERPAAYIDLSLAFASGCLYSTVEDLYRWGQALTSAHPALVSAQALRQMFMPYRQRGGPSGDRAHRRHQRLPQRQPGLSRRRPDHHLREQPGDGA